MAVAPLAAAVVAISLTGSCAAKPAVRTAVTPPLSPEILQARLAEADALAARGCYICLREAAEAYSKLADVFHDPFTLYRKTVENDLMLAIRELELRLPDSGARDSAYGLRQHVKANYDALFAALDFLKTPIGDRLSTGQAFQQDRATRQDLLIQLESQWPTSPAVAYFYLAIGRGFAYFAEAKQDPKNIADAHPQQAALRYAALLHPQAFTRTAADQLLADEPRFAEVHMLIGQRAMAGGNLATARRELIAAREILPNSLAVLSSLAPVEFAYARYDLALALFEEILTRGPDPQAQLGKAEALSYLKRHREAVAELDDLLEDPSRNPGEKYYWRAWNKLQLQELQPAYDDATAALRFTRGADAYRLAGIATFHLQRLPEARGYFESALGMQSADCDSIQYIGQLDAAEGKWPAAVVSFTRAAGCFRESLAETLSDLVKKEADNTGGLLDAQIAGLRSGVDSQRLLQAQSVQNAEIAGRNVRPPVP